MPAISGECYCSVHEKCCYWSLSCSSPTPLWTGDTPPTPRDRRQAARRRRESAVQHRRERGLLDYQACSLDQLRSFVKSRDVRSVRQNASRRKLIEALERTDDTVTFDRFMDLPPEIRVEIYGLHLAGLDNKPARPTQPPLTRVSRLTRQEALPLFYSDVVIPVTIEVHSSLDDSGKAMVPDVALLPGHYLSNLPNSVIRHVRKVKLNYRVVSAHCAFKATWSIDLPIRGTDGKFTKNERDFLIGDREAARKLTKAVERHMTELMREMSARSGDKKLCKGDFAAIEKACGAATLEAWDGGES